MPIRRRMLLPGALTMALAGRSAAQPAAAGEPVFAERGLAIRGFDPVAYFREGRPVRGGAAHTHAWRGATWRFATAANRDAFVADPVRFAPAYGGFCAFAVAHGYTAPIDPDAFRIVDGRLFLNYDRATQRRWEADIPGHVARGDAAWPALAGRQGR